MDRNTITALLLITVVLILTPYYMELVSPSPPPQPNYKTSDETDNSYDEANNVMWAVLMDRTQDNAATKIKQANRQGLAAQQWIVIGKPSASPLAQLKAVGLPGPLQS